SAAYGVAGRVVMNQSDLLVVVWDGDRKSKRGGTEDTFDEAWHQGTPIVWIDAYEPHQWQLLDSGAPWRENMENDRARPGDNRNLQQVRDRVRAVLDLPNQPRQKGIRDPDHSDNLHHFYAEHRPPRTLALVWTGFQRILVFGAERSNSKRPIGHAAHGR